MESSDESLGSGDIVYAESDDSPYEVEELEDDFNDEPVRNKRRKIEIEKNKRCKVKPATVTRNQCVGCEEDLISDVEDDNLKNIGCDKRHRWFHLKCTVLRGQPYEVAANKEFLCHVCFI